MVEDARLMFVVPVTGVGRRDYSQDVQVAVEPIIRDDQEKYNSGVIELSMPAGGSVQQEIPFETGYVYMLYDFCLSVPSRTLIRLFVQMYTAAGAWAAILNQYDYQTVKANLTKGFPLARKYRVTAYNYGADDLTGLFSAHGIRLEETKYYGMTLAQLGEPYAELV